MRTLERTFTFDRDLVRRADRKLHRFGVTLDDAMSRALLYIVTSRGVPEQFRPVPSVIEFDAQGEHFVADVTQEDGGYSAQVRNHPECYTCGDNEAELRKNLVEAAELAIFDIADEVYS